MDSTSTVSSHNYSVTAKAVCMFSNKCWLNMKLCFFHLRCLVCCIVPYYCVEQREWFSTPLSSCISYSAAIWSLLALLRCTKPYCGFPEISKEGVSEKRRERGWETPLKAPGLSPLSPPGNMPAFPKTLVLRGSSPCCPPPLVSQKDVKIYVTVTQSLPLLNSPSPLTAWESEGEFNSGGRQWGLLMFLQNRGGLRQTQCSFSAVSIWYATTAVICMCLQRGVCL